MRKKLVKLLFQMLCAAASVAGLCAAATALQVDGLTLEAGTLPPVAYQLEVIYEQVKCAKIEEINFGPGGDFAILHTRPTGIAGEFSIEDIRYISYYNAAGNQQFSLRLEETQDVKLKLTDTHLYVCLFPKLIEHDLQTHETRIYPHLSETNIGELYRKWNVNERDPVRDGWVYQSDGRQITREKDGRHQVILTLDSSWADLVYGDKVKLRILESLGIALTVLFVLRVKHRLTKRRKKTAAYTIEEMDE